MKMVFMSVTMYAKTASKLEYGCRNYTTLKNVLMPFKWQNVIVLISLLGVNIADFVVVIVRFFGSWTFTKIAARRNTLWNQTMCTTWKLHIYKTRKKNKHTNDRPLTPTKRQTTSVTKDVSQKCTDRLKNKKSVFGCFTRAKGKPQENIRT